MWLGIAAALLACALWGVTYVLPGLLPNYDVLHTGLVRCIIVGTCALLLTLPAHNQLKTLKATINAIWLVNNNANIKNLDVKNCKNFLIRLFYLI